MNEKRLDNHAKLQNHIKFEEIGQKEVWKRVCIWIICKKGKEKHEKTQIKNENHKLKWTGLS